jgi:hypothetical protein
MFQLLFEIGHRLHLLALQLHLLALQLEQQQLHLLDLE